MIYTIQFTAHIYTSILYYSINMTLLFQDFLGQEDKSCKQLPEKRLININLIIFSIDSIKWLLYHSYTQLCSLILNNCIWVLAQADHSKNHLKVKVMLSLITIINAALPFHHNRVVVSGSQHWLTGYLCEGCIIFSLSLPECRNKRGGMALKSRFLSSNLSRANHNL